MLGKIGLDIAVTHAFNHDLEGRTELHAAPEGGERLVSWYKNQGMKMFPKDGKLPLGRQLRGNDGRYFHFSGVDAIIFSQKLDKYR